MAYTNNIPNPNDNISTSQGQIKGNFQFLADTTTLQGIVIINGSSGNVSTGGYYKFPNGLYLQYAKVTKGANPTVADGTEISFIVPFPNLCISVVINPFTGANGVSANPDSSGLTTAEFLLQSSINLPSGLFFIALGY